MFDNGQIGSVTLFVSPSSELYPEDKLPENARLLKDFIWRGDEKINSLEEIFSDEEIQDEIDNKEDRLQKQKEAQQPMEVQKETLPALPATITKKQQPKKAF